LALSTKEHNSHELPTDKQCLHPDSYQDRGQFSFITD